MVALLWLFLALFASPFKSKSRLEAENAALRHQLIILRRKVRGGSGSRIVIACSSVLHPAVSMVSISHQGHHDCPPRDPRAMAPGRLPPVLALEVPLPWRPAANRRGPARADRRMSVDNPLWGAPRIHGELLKVDFEVAQSSVAKYMVKRCGPPSPPGWSAPSCVTMRLTSPPWICSSSGEKIIMPNRRGDRVLGPTLDPTKKTPRRARAKACWDSGFSSEHDCDSSSGWTDSF